MPKLLKQFSNASLYNITDVRLTVTNMLNHAQTKAIADETFRMDEIVKFSNPALYLLHETGRSGYIAGYSIVVCLFFMVVGVLVVLGDYFYKLMKESASN